MGDMADYEREKEDVIDTFQFFSKVNGKDDK